MMVIQPGRFSGKWRYIRTQLGIAGNPGGVWQVASIVISAGGVTYPLVPMTGNTAPAPFAVSVATSASDTDKDASNVYKAFDGNPATAWEPRKNIAPTALFDFGALSLPSVGSVSIALSNAEGGPDGLDPDAVIVSVSADGGAFTTIVNVTDARTQGWTSGVARVFTASAN